MEAGREVSKFPLCSLCLCVLCVKRNLPAAHLDAMQHAPATCSLNTDDTEAQRAQRRQLGNLVAWTGPSIPQGERAWAACKRTPERPQWAESGSSATHLVSCVAASCDV